MQVVHQYSQSDVTLVAIEAFVKADTFQVAFRRSGSTGARLAAPLRRFYCHCPSPCNPELARLKQVAIILWKEIAPLF